MCTPMYCQTKDDQQLLEYSSSDSSCVLLPRRLFIMLYWFGLKGNKSRCQFKGVLLCPSDSYQPATEDNDTINTLEKEFANIFGSFGFGLAFEDFILKHHTEKPGFVT